ncbi:hypothetical protein F511_23084 [Dorcoceras hygrometricum]|uniref:Uncharacterized protein n=1 Tax=Dorcoceras hygrometricum TaxID=472368 RepID=A0A2Z7ASS6_9LAMI|nr:hypothetical protein F511_23084 [Dorcoceras hygrometricum]
MSSPSTSRVGSAAESIDSASPISQAGEPWLPEPEELPTTPWYEEKASTLRDPWKCEMHWRDSAVTLVPRTPDRAPSLTPFLEAMHGKSYSAPELIREDLLCFYKFSRKGVELVGDLDERMGKAELLRAMQEAAAAPPKKPTRYICNMAPDRDVRVLWKARNADVVGHFSSHAAAGGEMVKRLTKAHQKMNASRDQFDKAMGQHAEVLDRLEELETLRSREKEATGAQREALEAQMQVAKEAHEAEKAAREMLEAELEEVKSRAAQDAERLKLEGKEEFLKSPEFDTLLGKKAGGFFKNGFFDCVAQWRANGYPEEEHPATFLNVQQAIAEMPDEEEVQEEEEDEDEEEGGDGSEATPPKLPSFLIFLLFYASLPVRNWAYVPSWSGLCICVEELREFASTELGLCAELVGLMYSRRRATRVCQCGTGLMCRAGRALCIHVEELREFVSAELGLCAELVGLMYSRRRATRVHHPRNSIIVTMS